MARNLSYYREEKSVKEVLSPLLSCKMIRNWGEICIECLDAEHMEEIFSLLEYLRKPILEIGIARAIVVSAPNEVQRTFPVKVPFHTDLLA